MQSLKLSRFVDESSVLCTQDAHPLGRVEEVFGPIDEPLYSFRYACGKALPESLTPGSSIMSVEKLSTYITPETVQVGMCWQEHYCTQYQTCCLE